MNDDYLSILFVIKYMVEAVTHYAVCVLNPDGGSGVSGVVRCSQVEGQKVKISAEIKGLTPGQHGFHIHQFGKIVFLCQEI